MKKMLQRDASSEMLKLGPSHSLPCLAFEAHRRNRRGKPNPTALTSNIAGSWAGGWEAREAMEAMEERKESRLRRLPHFHRGEERERRDGGEGRSPTPPPPSLPQRMGERSKSRKRRKRWWSERGKKGKRGKRGNWPVAPGISYDPPLTAHIHSRSTSCRICSFVRIAIRC